MLGLILVLLFASLIAFLFLASRFAVVMSTPGHLRGEGSEVLVGGLIVVGMIAGLCFDNLIS